MSGRETPPFTDVKKMQEGPKPQVFGRQSPNVLVQSVPSHVQMSFCWTRSPPDQPFRQITTALLEWGVMPDESVSVDTSAPIQAAGASQERAERLYERMYLIRRTEETLLDLFSKGKLAGTTHTCIGQEAISAAVGENLRSGDVVFGTHRGHGHYLSYGGPLDQLLAEVMGRNSKLCGGRGGSQHLHFENFYSNGVLGGTVGNATGVALAERLKGTEAITVAFLGDGTLGEGIVYESLNFAALHSLPILYVLEHNRYAQSTPSRLGVSGSMPARAAAFGIDSDEIETNDVDVLCELFRDRMRRVREERRPSFQVVHTYRLAPHSKGDDTRDPEEIETWRAGDPLRIQRSRLSRSSAEAAEARVELLLAKALDEAEAVPFPPVEARAVRSQAPSPDPAPWSQASMTYVESLNAGLARLLEADPGALFMGEDVLSPYGGAFKVARGLSTRFPDQVISTPVSEAGIVAWGTGAAMRGIRPVVEVMFGDFVALAADQLVNHASKYRWIYNETVDVPLVVRTPMGGRRGYGATHSQSLEAMFIGVPGLQVVAPSTLLDPGELLRRASSHAAGPVLFIENKLLYARRLDVPAAGRLGNFFVKAGAGLFPTVHLSLNGFQPADAVILTYGGSAPIALEAAERLLLEDEVLCDVVLVHQLAPIPVEDLAAGVGTTRLVLTLEEGPVRGGWGASVVAALVEAAPGTRRFRRIGGPDSPLPSSKPLEEALLPSVTSIVEAVRSGA